MRATGTFERLERDTDGTAIICYRTGKDGPLETVRGRAVVVSSPHDAIERLEPGDVLVTNTTTPAYNVVLPLVGGLVTVFGGTGSHPAVVARELGVSAVIGCADALERIPDGAEIELDPVSGTVRIVG